MRSSWWDAVKPPIILGCRSPEKMKLQVNYRACNDICWVFFFLPSLKTFILFVLGLQRSNNIVLIYVLQIRNVAFWCCVVNWRENVRGKMFNWYFIVNSIFITLIHMYVFFFLKYLRNTTQTKLLVRIGRYVVTDPGFMYD